MTPHVWCPKCKMEALRLVADGKRCDWCVERPNLGRPFDAKRWPDMVAALSRRVAETVAAAEKAREAA